MYHHLVETLKFARGQRWRLGDPRSHPKLQNASRDLLEETLAQLIRQQFDGRGDHQLSHYSLAEAWGHGTDMSHVCAGGGWQRRGCHQHHQHTVRGAWGKAGGLTPPLLDLHSPSPMSPHLSPWGRTLLLPFVSSSVSKEEMSPPLTSLAGKAAAGVAPSQDLSGNGRPHSEGCPDVGAQVGLWGPLLGDARERTVAPACFGTAVK